MSEHDQGAISRCEEESFDVYWDLFNPPGSSPEAQALQELKRFRRVVWSSALRHGHKREQFGFERVVVTSEYDRVRTAVERLAVEWGRSFALPNYSRRSETSQALVEQATQLAQHFEPATTICDAAQQSCMVWVLRRLGVELIPSLFSSPLQFWQNLEPIGLESGFVPGPAEWALASGSTDSVYELVDAATYWLTCEDGRVDPWNVERTRAILASGSCRLQTAPAALLVYWAMANGALDELRARAEQARADRSFPDDGLGTWSFLFEPGTQE